MGMWGIIQSPDLPTNFLWRPGIYLARAHTLLVNRNVCGRTETVVPISDQVFDGWVREYQRLLFRIAYWWTGSRTDAEELTQEAFFQAYRSRSSLRDIGLVKGWLVGIMRHCYSQTRRKNRYGKDISLEEIPYEPEERSAPDADVLALHQSLAKLEEHYRLPVVMFYFQDLSYSEIAMALDLPLGTIMSRLSRARKLLYESLDAKPQPILLKKVSE
jgi:RNA polymerase sigma-70 factor (ECF subfamily)